ncbi:MULTISPECIES: YbhB/YbcL family Raf kinase inhibitor-like protein [Catenuloplanes]|uniref:Raf kinase inhibitor-like YbhB/YbcL family protein n=1 Tax=Catenuloplanes niger TaxID=587534 RepID=A0AAE3ZL71_9ACTN|nr:YbhB/YbcL family Raf kinase inhibitor-like protein [Catenuloplanes niger]MDR7320198.1 Raf kinase inhibitor-like YbhB/YbcL family protein [Catenuloplanes niger]
MRTGHLIRWLRAGTAHSVWNAPAFQAPETIGVSSSDFADGGPIPDAHVSRRAGGENVSPELTWTAPPYGTAQLLLILEDADVPFPRPLIHTVALLPAETRTLARGGLRPGNPSVRSLRASLGATGYAGPMPPPGHGPHHYEFTLYALERPVPAGVRSIGAVRRTVDGHVLARGRLTGTYER